jgi:hypothetical protein
MTPSHVRYLAALHPVVNRLNKIVSAVNIVKLFHQKIRRLSVIIVKVVIYSPGGGFADSIGLPQA